MTKAIAKPDSKQGIVDILNKIKNIYQSAGDKGKVMGYGRAISQIKALGKEIHDVSQLDGVPGIGDGIKKKVREYLAEGKMTKLDELKGDSKMMVLEAFGKIWGVGPVAA